MPHRSSRLASQVLALSILSTAVACGSGTENSAPVRPGFSIRITDSTGAVWSGTGSGAYSAYSAYTDASGDTVGFLDVWGVTDGGFPGAARRLYLSLVGDALVPIPAGQAFVIGGDPANTVDGLFDIISTFEAWIPDSGRILIEIVDDSLLRATASLRAQSPDPGQKPLRIKSTIVAKLPANAP
jgi:hypothetical protein